MITIRTPETEQEWEAYYDLRFRILRAPLNQPVGSERNEGDATGKHFALFENQTILAVARLDLMAEQSCQVRWVAVETNLQGQGYGKAIMNAVETKAKELGCTTVMLQARDYAVTFYEGLDYKIIAPSFKLFDVLQHFEMRKQLL